MIYISDYIETARKGKSEITDPGKIRFENNPRPVVVWNLLDLCNMKCPHCYIAATTKGEEYNLTTEDCITIINKLADYGVRILILSGGEPLLRRDIFSLIKYVKSKGMSCHLSTNGTLITSDIAELLKTLGIGYVGISIDGEEGFNDKYRGLAGGFQKAMEGFRHLGALGVPTGLRMTVTSGNSEQVSTLIGLAKNEKIRRFYLSHLVYEGRAKSYRKNDLVHQETRRIMDEIIQETEKILDEGNPIKIVTGGNDADGPYVYLYILKKYGKEVAALVWDLLERRGGNSSGEKIINIDHHGNVHPDQFWRTTDSGSLLSKSLEDILSGELYQQLKVRESLLQGRCGKCRFKKLCRGSHRERALVVHGGLWDEDPSCYLTEKEIYEV